MDEFLKEKLKYIPILFVFISWQCANQMPPSGGGIDLIPPKIVNTYPLNGTVNYNKDYVEFQFSKYLQNRTLQEALFISPAIKGDLKYDWSGTSVKIYFPEKLKANTTYIITVGTDLKDYNNGNPLAEAYNLTFATGNEIFKGEITGRIYADQPRGTLLYAYSVGDSAINPVVKKPDYLSQSGNDGLFKILGLAPGYYRVFAVDDKSGSFLYDPQQDKIGIPFRDVHITLNDSLFRGLDFFLSNRDTLKPRIQSAIMTDVDHLFLSFSKDIDTSMIKSSNFFIYDSTSNKRFSVLYAYKGNKKDNEMNLVQVNKFPAKDEVYLIVKKITDKLGNQFENDYSLITLGDKPDTTKPGIFNVIPSPNTNQADYEDQKFSFYASDAIDSNLAKTGISFSDTSGNKIPYSIHFYDNASFYIQSENFLLARTDYLIKLDLRKFKNAAGKYYDSVYTYKFQTINGLDFTGVTGTVHEKDSIKYPVLVLQGIDSRKNIYYQKPDSKKKFKFSRITGGKYRLWYFDDTDQSGNYSYGNSFPFKPSEKFSFYPDTLNLRPRWTVTGIDFYLK